MHSQRTLLLSVISIALSACALPCTGPAQTVAPSAAAMQNVRARNGVDLVAPITAVELQNIQQARLKLAPAEQVKIRALAPAALAQLNEEQKRVFRAGGHIVLGVTPASGRPIGQLTGSKVSNADVEKLIAIDKASQNLQTTTLNCKKLYPNIVVPPLPTNYMPPPAASLPAPNASMSKFNWRDAGYTTPAKDQGWCGSCWAFSLTGAVESAVLRENPALVASHRAAAAASDQDVLSCSNDGTCNGGNSYNAAGWVLWRGQSSQLLAPYLDIHTSETSTGPGTMAACKASWTPSYMLDGEGAVTTGTETLPHYGNVYYANVATLKSALAQRGPIVIYLWADGSLDGVTGDQVYDADFEGDGTNATNHAVLLVGWDDTKGAWLIKNSWSQGWGNQGFGYIAYNTNNLGVFGGVWVHASTEPTDTQFPNYASELAAHNAALAKSLEVKCTPLTVAKQGLQLQINQVFKLGPGIGPDPIGPVVKPSINVEQPAASKVIRQ